MTTDTMAVELAVETRDGWLFLEEVATEDAAIEAAKLWSPQFRTSGFRAGVVAFGISSDPHSGHYETRVEVYEDGTVTVQ